MKQKKMIAILLCMVMLFVTLSYPAFSAEKGMEEEELYIEVETTEGDVAVEGADKSAAQQDEESRIEQEDIAATKEPEIVEERKENLNEQPVAAEEAVLSEETLQKDSAEELETLYNEYIEGFGDNETQKQLYAALVEERKAAGTEIDRDILSQIMAEVIAETYDEIMVINQSTDTQKIMQSSGRVELPSFPTPAKLFEAEKTSSVPFVAVAAYEEPHSMVVSKGKVYAAGALLGCSAGITAGQWDITRVPLQCVDEDGNQITNVKTVSLGHLHSLMLKEDGTVWGAGYNEYSKLGTGDGNDRYAAVQVKGANGIGYLENVKSISAGKRHSIAVKNDGTVWAWGSNSNGQFGTGNRTMSLYPKQMPISNVKQACASKDYTVILTEDGHVYTAGCNDKGQLGDGTREDRMNFVRVKGLNGSGYLSNIVEISAGDSSVMALDSDGTVWAWGLKDSGVFEPGITGSMTPIKVQKEDGTNLNNIVSVAAGHSEHYAITTEGELWELSYTLGDPDNLVNRPRAVQKQGINGEGYFENVVQVSAGNYSHMAVCSDRKVYTWGFNDKGQFGTGELDNHTAVPVPAYTVNFVADDHGDYAEEATPITLDESIAGNVMDEEDVDFFAFTSGTAGSYRISTGADVNINVYDQENRRMTEAFDGYTFAASETYYIAIRSYTEMDYTFKVEKVSSPSHITIDVSDYEAPHTMLYKHKNLYGAGYNYSGQLSTGENKTYYSSPVQAVDQNDRLITDVKKISAGNNSTLILKNDGTVWATGTNGYNKLGIPLTEGGNARNINKAEQVCGQGGSGYLTEVVDISAGNTHTLALKSDGTVWAWGSSSHGQLGAGNRTMQLYPTQVPDLTDVIAIKAGDQTSMALKADGTVWMWGKNDQKQLGAGHSENEVMVPVQVKGENGNGYLQNIKGIDMSLKCSYAVDESGQVWSWGNNTNGALGIGTSEFASFPTKVVKEDGTLLTNMKSISAGNYHAGAVGYDGSVWMWGKNTSRQLGDKTRNDRNAAIQTKGLTGEGALSDVQVLSCGYEYTMAIQKDGTVLAWGYDNCGQFGIEADTYEMYDHPIEAFIIIGTENSDRISIVEGQEYIVNVIGRNIRDLSGSISITYNTSELEVLDICAQTYEKELSAGTAMNGRITIEQFDPQNGLIKIKINRTIPSGKIYSGFLNMIQFKAKMTGETELVINK